MRSKSLRLKVGEICCGLSSPVEVTRSSVSANPNEDGDDGAVDDGVDVERRAGVGVGRAEWKVGNAHRRWCGRSRSSRLRERRDRAVSALAVAETEKTRMRSGPRANRIALTVRTRQRGRSEEVFVGSRALATLELLPSLPA